MKHPIKTRVLSHWQVTGDFPRNRDRELLEITPDPYFGPETFEISSYKIADATVPL